MEESNHDDGSYTADVGLALFSTITVLASSASHVQKMERLMMVQNSSTISNMSNNSNASSRSSSPSALLQRRMRRRANSVTNPPSFINSDSTSSTRSGTPLILSASVAELSPTSSVCSQSSPEDLRKEVWGEGELDRLFIAASQMDMDDAAGLYDPFSRKASPTLTDADLTDDEASSPMATSPLSKAKASSANGSKLSMNSSIVFDNLVSDTTHERSYVARRRPSSASSSSPARQRPRSNSLRGPTDGDFEFLKRATRGMAKSNVTSSTSVPSQHHLHSQQKRKSSPSSTPKSPLTRTHSWKNTNLKPFPPRKVSALKFVLSSSIDSGLQSPSNDTTNISSQVFQSSLPQSIPTSPPSCNPLDRVILSDDYNRRSSYPMQVRSSKTYI
eukprot:m.104212 g.104212  ORF g.104212 m.104212 type:complete len:388 (+) comp9106_c0_seq1:308-1471(+)